MPCMCGASDCPSCGPAQGTRAYPGDTLTHEDLDCLEANEASRKDEPQVAALETDDE